MIAPSAHIPNGAPGRAARIVSLATALCWWMAAMASYPVVRNFSHALYDAGPQNWAIAQTEEGDMLFGNSYGLLTFDSRNWGMLQLDNRSAVRSVLTDAKHGRVYVGGSNDFGYFAADAYGIVSYTSLRPTIDKGNAQDFTEIWNIHADGDKVWFQGDFKIYIYDGARTRVIPAKAKISASRIVNGSLYTAMYDGSLARVSEGGTSMIDTGALPPDAIVCSILPAGASRLILVTHYHGLYLFDGNTVSPYPSRLDAFMKENQVFCADIAGDNVVIGTVSNGAVVKNLRTGAETYVNRSCGLQNNTVLKAAFDKTGNLWLGLDNGIGYVMLNSPISRLLGDADRYGAGYASLLTDGVLYLGTNQGLYSMPYPTLSLAAASALDLRLKGQVWAIDRVDGTTFVCNDVGLFILGNGTLQKIDGVPGTVSVVAVPDTDDEVLASTYNNFYLLRRTGGTWQNAGRMAGYTDISGRPVVDDSGHLWMRHWLKGLYRLHANTGQMKFDKVEFYDSRAGLPADNGNVPSVLNGEIVVGTQSGYYRFDAKTRRFVPHPSIPDYLKSTTADQLYFSPDNAVWMLSPSSIKMACADPAGKMEVDSVSYRYLADKMIPGYENFGFSIPGHILVSSLDGFYDIDLTSAPAKASANERVSINAVYANQDSLLYSTRLFKGDIDKISVPSGLNSLVIKYIDPEYRSADAVQYSIMLENYDRGWSSPSTSVSKEYTRLSHGTYTFRVKALNTYTGVTTEDALTIEILPPWYLSVWAKIVYVLMALCAIYLAIRRLNSYSTRKAREVARRKEAELTEMQRQAREEAMKKDFEIERLKSEQLEQDIRSKGGELSHTTMNVIRKNEILMDISARLTKIVDGVDGSIEKSRLEKQIDRIKKLIRENISHDDDWRTFTHNFDLVYDNYLKRLTETYPQLTVTDQRLCAYIKMGLSSKEIAPLLNISYRSVEMSRYRLRKKIGLDSEIGLSEYLRNFTGTDTDTDTKAAE